MAHFAEVDENNIVLRVLVTDNNDPAGDEGYSWLLNTFGGRWLKTSYNTRLGEHLEGGTPFRKNFAGPGYVYDEALDAFLPPKPYESWLLNEEIGDWYAPISYPQDGKFYVWDEASINWIVEK